MFVVLLMALHPTQELEPPADPAPFSQTLSRVFARDHEVGGQSLTDLEPILDVLEDWSEQLKGVDLSEFSTLDTGVSPDPVSEPADDDVADAPAAQFPADLGGPS